jgi:VanZ family protein
MQSLINLVAKAGTNLTFVAAMAHFWFAFSMGMLFHSNFLIICLLLVTFAVKEFWFDATYEVPKQKFIDNLTDFIGYFVGVMFGALIVGF